MNTFRPITEAATDDPGHAFLAFVNTVGDEGKSRDRNSFEDPAGLRAILTQHGLDIGPATPNPSQMHTIVAFREAAYAVLAAVAAGRRPGREETLQLESAIKATLQDSGLGFDRSGLDITPGPLGGAHDRLVLSFLDLMQGSDLDRLRECRRCSHLFLDHGRGTGRRWCSMARCGNRAKAEAFRARQKQSQT